MRCRRRVKAIERIGDRFQRGEEAERVIGEGDIVVDCLRNADRFHTMFSQPMSNSHRVVASNGD